MGRTSTCSASASRRSTATRPWPTSRRDCRKLADELKLELRFHQSNREYEIIDWIHEAREIAGGLAINPGAFTHTSVAILDALNTFEPPVIEVHISNVHKRESFRHHSYVSLRADGVIAGLGHAGLRAGAAPAGAPDRREGEVAWQRMPGGPSSSR